MDANKKTSLKKILIITITIVVLLTLIYIIPRMRVVLEHKEVVKDMVGFEKLDIEGEWNGEYKKVESDNIKLMLPIEKINQNDEIKHTAHENKDVFEGYGFILILDNDKKNLIANEPIENSQINKWLGAYSSNEYDYKLVQMNKPIFFQPYKKFKEQYRHYFNLYLTYSFHGNKYFSYSNGKFAFAGVLDDIIENDGDKYYLIIHVYDINKNYDSVFDISIVAIDELTPEKILFVLDTIEIN